MKTILKNVLFVTILFLVVPVLGNEIFAASLNFGSSTVSGTNGGNFQIAVTVDPGSDSLNSTDAYVTYDSSLLKPIAVAAGTMFPTVTNDITTTPGKVYIAGMVNDPASSISTGGTLATITFQGLKNGTGTLAFDCASSKIIKNDINATNVITCSSNGTSAVTIGSGSAAAAPTSAPSSLPRTGTLDNVVKFGVPGIIILLLGSISRLFL